MNRTRLFWGETGVIAVLLLGVILTGHPILLAGAGILVAFLLSRQLTYVWAVVTIFTSLEVTHTVTRSTTDVDERVFVTVDVSLPRPAPVEIDVDVNPPVTAQLPSSIDPTVHLDAGQQVGTLTFPVSWAIAGTFEFNDARVTIHDPFGLFDMAFSRTAALSITVDTTEHRRIHIGKGGRQLGTAFMGTSAGRTRPGVEPIEVREYVPGDTLKRIDWNATARLNRPHIREYETESERSLLFVIDHRSHLMVGERGDTAFNHLRTVALGVLAGAKSRNDLVSLVSVGDEGPTFMQPIRATADAFTSIRRELLSIDTPDVTGEAIHHYPGDWSPRRTSRTLKRLETDESAFGRIISEYHRASAAAIQGTSQPLYSTVNNALERFSHPSWTIIFTDDTNPKELRQTIDTARKRGSRVIAYIAPRALFHVSTIGDPTSMGEEYMKFDSFRRDLDTLADVEVFEVGPSDRLRAITESRPPTTDG